MKNSSSLFNCGFIALNVLILFAFSNLAVFYSFYSYLETTSIPQAWYGILIGLFSASALVVRPFISTRLHLENSVKGVAIGLIFTITVLPCYAHAQTLLPLIFLRVLHGAAYVTLVSSAVHLLVAFMPPDRSGQGFSIVTMMTLLPYAIFPYVIENFANKLSLGTIYSITALFMLPALLMLIAVARQLRKPDPGHEKTSQKVFGSGLKESLKNPQVLLLLVANGLVFSVFSLVFFFLKSFCSQSGIGNPGLFFTTATGTMIAVRFVFGRVFDRFNKACVTIISLSVLVSGLLLLRDASTDIHFYAAAVLYGIGIGAATPLMNGLMFSVSPPRHRGLNTNLMLEMVDVGFFIGPALCGLALDGGFDQVVILSGCVGAIGLAAGMMVPLIKTKPLGE